MDLYNIDPVDVHMVIHLLDKEVERLLAGCEESVGHPTLPRWQALHARAVALRQRLADEVMHEHQTR